MKTRRKNEGFTLIELMVVLVILGLLAAIVMPRFFGQGEKAKITAARVQMKVIEDALHQYEIENGGYPTTEQGLDALVKKPSVGTVPPRWREGGYLEKTTVPKDPWGNPYVYTSPGANGTDYDLYSYGADGAPGGEGNNKDISAKDEP